MLADLDLLLIAVFCAADDLLPERPSNARRSLTDAEVVTLCVAQAIMGIPSDERFLKVARKRLVHLFPRLPQRPGFHKRRGRLAETIEALTVAFARDSPGFHDDLVLVDSTPVEYARSIETTRRSQLGDAADYGYCASHSRYFWGFRLHGLFGLDGTPRALALTSPKTPERDVCLALLERVERQGSSTVIGDKGYAGRNFEQAARRLDASIARPRRKDETPRQPPARPDPTADRIDLPDLQRPAHPRTPRRPHPPRPSESGSAAASSPSPQPSASTIDSADPAARPHRLHRLNPWNYSSRECRHVAVLDWCSEGTSTPLFGT